jgi:hypothetical protein
MIKITRWAAYYVGALVTVMTVLNLFMPYGNHLVMAWGVGRDERNLLDMIIFRPALSRAIIEMRGVSCDLPMITLPLNLFRVRYVPSKGTAISSIAILYKAHINEQNEERDSFILNHLKKTIYQCDPNADSDGIPPLINVILMCKPEILSDLIARGADVNVFVKREKTGTTYWYTPLLFAEKLLEATDDEASKIAYKKIVAQLKQAGAYAQYKSIDTR